MTYTTWSNCRKPGRPKKTVSCLIKQPNEMQSRREGILYCVDDSMNSLNLNISDTPVKKPRGKPPKAKAAQAAREADIIQASVLEADLVVVDEVVVSNEVVDVPKVKQ